MIDRTVMSVFIFVSIAIFLFSFWIYQQMRGEGYTHVAAIRESAFMSTLLLGSVFFEYMAMATN